MIRTLILVIAGLVSVSSSAWAYRVLEPIENAHELSLGQVRLPDNERGMITFTACDTCRTTALRVTGATQYFANGTLVALEDLRETAADLLATTEGRETASIYIYYDIASLRVNRVKLSYRN